MQQKAAGKLNLLGLRRQYTNPHGLYRAMREQDCLYFDSTSQTWLVTGHAAVTTILDDPRFLSGLSPALGAGPTQISAVHRQMLFMDGEKHRRAQNVMLRPLAQMVKQIAADIRTFAQDALAQVCRAGEMEVVSEFASPISLLTIAHVLGIPLEDRDELRQLERWSDTFGDITSGYFLGAREDVQKLEEYFRRLIARKRRAPAHDLLSSFIRADDIFPTEEDLVANCMMVFAAGRITTKKLLGNGVSLLLPHWGDYQNQGKESTQFFKTAGEELLRMVTPTRYLIREAGTDVDLSPLFPGRHVIRRGQKILLFLEAANYDPAVFTQPEHFNPLRRPNKHIAFGYGPHQCPGATLARVEIQVALEELFCLHDMRPRPATTPVWNPNPNLGGFISNPVVFASTI